MWKYLKALKKYNYFIDKFYIINCLEPCKKHCKNQGRCQLKNNSQICVCFGFYFGDSCQFNSLVLFILGALLMSLSFIMCIIIWIIFYKKKK